MRKNENILLTFGKRVRQLRIQKNMTQEQFAQKCDLHKNYIGMIERGERNPSLINIEIIACTFEISLSELLKID